MPVLLLSILALGSSGYALPAFTGAEGFGSDTIGGRGGRVIKVVNLNSSGPGSLQAACNTPGPRIIVFEVSGVITGDIVITEPYITIAGQTAPGAGITIRGMLRTASRKDPVHDVVARFLRVRPDPGRGSQLDAIQFSVVDNAVLDHISCSWAEDETIDIYSRATRVTIQWCTIEESATKGHAKGPHNYGLIAGPGSSRISIHHNLFVHQRRRNPAIATGPADFRNNVVYNFRDGFSHEGHPPKPPFSIVGNYYKRGPSDSKIFPFCFVGNTPYYLADNYIEDVGLIQNPWAEAGKLYGLGYYKDKGVRQIDEPEMAPVKTHHPKDAYDLVLAQSGCFPRDAVTKRVVRDVINGTGSWGRKEQKDLMEGLTPSKAPPDSDNDGMPDEWEKINGFDEKRYDADRKTASGYTAIEKYLDELAERIIRSGRRTHLFRAGSLGGVFSAEVGKS
jgi:pectate lyase